MTRASLLAVAVLLSSCAHGPGPAAPDPRSSAAPLTLELPKFPDGPPHSLVSDRGNVVLLDVWATWCEPCKDALPAYERFVERFGARGFRVYAITVDEDPNQVRKFLDESKLSLPVLVDKNAAVAAEVLRVSMMPTSFLVDRAGVVRFVHEGYAATELPKYEAQIEALLAKPAPSSDPTR